MRKNTVIALLLAFVMMFTVVAPVAARTPEETLQIRQYLQDQIDLLHANNQMSNDEVYSVHVNLSLIPEYGKTTATVYKTVYEESTVTSFDNIKLQPIEGINGAHDKLVRFFFYLDNNDDENFLAQWGGAPPDTVIGYVYGTTKDQTLTSFIAGIPECLERQRLYDNPSSSSSGGGGSAPITPPEPEPEPEIENPDAWAEKYITTTFTINQSTYTLSATNPGNTTDNKIITPATQTMDVAPYIKNDRTYVPVRYLAYSLGVPENNVTWNGQARRVGITKDDTSIALIIGSSVMYVNQQPIRMGVSPEITNNRTFLPARWVAEALGAEVAWDNKTKQAIIKVPTTKPGN